MTGVNIDKTGEKLEPVVRSFYINETDEYAIDEALALRNKYGGQVTVISSGPVSSEEKLQIAIAKGADKALRIDLSSADPVMISSTLAEHIRKVKYDLVLTGLESSDNLAAQVGIATAERLGIPFLFAATQIEILSGGSTARVTKEMGNAIYQVLDINLPALIAVQTGIQKLSYAPVAKLLQAKRRGIDCIKPDQGIAENTRKWKYLEITQARRKHSARYLEGTPGVIASEIVTKMKEVW